MRAIRLCCGLLGAVLMLTACERQDAGRTGTQGDGAGSATERRNGAGDAGARRDGAGGTGGMRDGGAGGGVRDGAGGGGAGGGATPGGDGSSMTGTGVTGATGGRNGAGGETGAGKTGTTGIRSGETNGGAAGGSQSREDVIKNANTELARAEQRVQTLRQQAEEAPENRRTDMQRQADDLNRRVSELRVSIQRLEAAGTGAASDAIQSVTKALTELRRSMEGGTPGQTGQTGGRQQDPNEPGSGSQQP